MATSNVIQIKRRSGSAGAPAALKPGELASNLDTPSLYIGDASGAVVTLLDGEALIRRGYRFATIAAGVVTAGAGGRCTIARTAVGTYTATFTQLKAGDLVVVQAPPQFLAGEVSRAGQVVTIHVHDLAHIAHALGDPPALVCYALGH